MIIAPSLLSANCAKLGQEVTDLINAGADWIHLDVMDNHYAPNLTMGPMFCRALKPYCTVPLDVHLMVTPVDAMIDAFALAGADSISIHPESSLHFARSLALIKSYGIKAGVALNPSSTLSHLEYVMDLVDIVLLMSVNPGYAGQVFIESSKTKIVQLNELIIKSGRNIVLAVDGGVTLANIALLAKLGVSACVMGSTLFINTDYAKTISAAKQAILQQSTHSYSINIAE